MNLNRFIRLLHTFGADFRRWPSTDQEAGRQLSESSAAARDEWQIARRIDDLFARDRDLPLDLRRTTAIADLALRRVCAQPRQYRGPLVSKRIAVALAATVLIGWLLGLFFGPHFLASATRGVPAVDVLLGYGTADSAGSL